MNLSEIKQKISEHIKNEKNPIIVILGPTASGKTKLSIDIAKTFDCEIISTDSRQIYKEMDIATDMITEDEMQGIPHYMVGIANPNEVITLSDFKKIAISHIENILKREKTPILVGGTGLYINSIVENYDLEEGVVDNNLRQSLLKELDEKGAEYMHKKLCELDKYSGEKIHKNNTRYVIRAIEINLLTGENKKDLKKESKYSPIYIAINWPREIIYKRIEERVDLLIKKGLIDEVRGLVEKKYDENLPSMTSLGVKEIIPYIKGEKTLDECVDELKKNTRHYAKRQVTWFKRFKNILLLEN